VYYNTTQQCQCPVAWTKSPTTCLAKLTTMPTRMSYTQWCMLLKQLFFEDHCCWTANCWRCTEQCACCNCYQVVAYWKAMRWLS